MSKFVIFKPEDFRAVANPLVSELVSQIANEKLKSLIETWPVVYSSNSGLIGSYREYSAYKMPNSDQKARLAFIEELPKPKCKHEPEYTFSCGPFPSSGSVVCKHCGIELQPKWEPKV